MKIAKQETVEKQEPELIFEMAFGKAWKDPVRPSQNRNSLIHALKVAATAPQHLQFWENHLLRLSDSSVLSLFQKPLLHLLLGAEESAQSPQEIQIATQHKMSCPSPILSSTDAVSTRIRGRRKKSHSMQSRNDRKVLDLAFPSVLPLQVSKSMLWGSTSLELVEKKKKELFPARIIFPSSI